MSNKHVLGVSESVAGAIPNVCKITRELIMRWENEK